MQRVPDSIPEGLNKGSEQVLENITLAYPGEVPLDTAGHPRSDGLTQYKAASYDHKSKATNITGKTAAGLIKNTDFLNEHN